MFRFCSSVNVKEPEESEEASDEIVKQHAFSERYDLRYESTKDFNDFDLYKLTYLGPLDYSYKELLYLFDEPRVYDNLNGSSMKNMVWYIKFNNGNICSISKHYRYHINKYFVNNFKICGNHRSVLLDLAYVLK